MSRSKSFMQGIIFDCDGTLVDSEQWHYLAWQTSLANIGYTLTQEFYCHHIAGVGDEAIAHMAKTFLPSCNITDLIHHKHTLFKAYQINGIAPIRSTVDFLKQLFIEKEKRNLKLAIASGAKKEEILLNLKSLGITHYFDAILSGYDDLEEYEDAQGKNKPKPYVYLKAAKMLGLEPSECIAIEDSHTGVISATSAGCFTVAIANEYTKYHDLSKAHLKLISLASFSIDEFLRSPFIRPLA